MCAVRRKLQPAKAVKWFPLAPIPWLCQRRKKQSGTFEEVCCTDHNSNCSSWVLGFRSAKSSFSASAALTSRRRPRAESAFQLLLVARSQFFGFCSDVMPFRSLIFSKIVATNRHENFGILSQNLAPCAACMHTRGFQNRILSGKIWQNNNLQTSCAGTI